MTGGCSIEVQDFQKKLSTFKKLGFDVFGASKDSIEKNTKFSDKYKLKYELGSDLTDVCEKLGIWIEKSMYGKKYFGIKGTGEKLLANFMKVFDEYMPQEGETDDNSRNN